MHSIDTSLQRPTRTSQSIQMMERARRSIAGGDSSTMRVLPYHLPLVADYGRGSHVWDLEGMEYIDLNMAFGPLLLGHCPATVIDAVTRQISEKGSQLGFPTEITVRVAEKVKTIFPSIELLRFANSGTEACASAIRLARTYTKRKKLIMFEGHYHGWSEAVFNRYHAPIEELPATGYRSAMPGTAGMSDSLGDVLLVRWNDLDTLSKCLEDHRGSVAGVVMEPVMGNAGVIPPEPGYLQGVRELTLDHDCMLIFDEVITGLRVAAGGAQELYLVQPDITIVSKSMGGGYPVAAFGASREIMNVIVERQMFHGGVYSGNAVVMAACDAVLDAVIDNREEMYKHMNSVSDALAAGAREIFNRLGIPNIVQNIGAMISFFLTDGKISRITNYRDVKQHCDFDKYIEFQHYMQRSGVYFHPNQFEPMFLSTAHTSDDIATVLERIEEAARVCLVQ